MQCIEILCAASTRVNFGESLCCGLLVLYLALGVLRCIGAWCSGGEGVVYHFLATPARPGSQNNATASQATRLISQNFTLDHSSADQIKSKSHIKADQKSNFISAQG